jgi:hypothetical protein
MHMNTCLYMAFLFNDWWCVLYRVSYIRNLLLFRRRENFIVCFSFENKVLVDCEVITVASLFSEWLCHN